MDLDFGKDVAWDKPCEYCLANKQGNRVFGFSLPYYLLQDPATEPAAAVARSLEQAGDLRHGRLFRCRYCGRPWVDNGHGYCSGLTKRDIPVVIRWNDHTLAPDAHLPALAEIGATQPWLVEALYVPCRASVGSKWFDPCRVQLQNAPPLVAGERTVIFIDDVTRIEATEFALPLELREYSHHVPERAMGYAPFVVYWGHEEVGLNGIQELWGTGGMMGKDLSLKPRELDWIPTARRPQALAIQRLAVVIADLNGAAKAALTRSGE